MSSLLPVAETPIDMVKRYIHGMGFKEGGLKSTESRLLKRESNAHYTTGLLQQSPT
jgi:hypothetical protein